ncbi:MAG TPA: hypothetical protein VFE58_17835 [Tepidisphaeraceae bacterium]|jgi:hypothetical protein|nr:hypothetical protein [Tepidisphaeraceae bacterium]
MEVVPTGTGARAKRGRRGAYLVLGMVLGVLAVCVWAWIRQSGWLSYWHLPEDWRGTPVVETTWEQTGWRKYVYGGEWRDLPFELSGSELRDLGRCQRLAMQQGVTIDGVNQFANDEVGAELESIVKKRPKLFYGEYALARWYAVRGDAAKAHQWMNQAYADAPVIFVQRYVDAAGKPMVGVSVRTFAIECNRVKKNSLDPSLELTYWDLTTDRKGCIYLPAYETVCRLKSMASPEGLEANYPKLGWFEVRGKVGVLPVAVVEAAK